MAKTVIGIFKDNSDAQKALNRLQEKGISRDRVDISRGEYKDATADRDGRNTNRVTDFFNKLFGHDSDDAKRYSTVADGNVTIVTVHAGSSDEAEEAADVLDDCGAEDVDKKGSGVRDDISSISDSKNDLSNDTGSISRGEVNLQEKSNQNESRYRSRIIDRSIDNDSYRLRDL